MKQRIFVVALALLLLTMALGSAIATESSEGAEALQQLPEPTPEVVLPAEDTPQHTPEPTPEGGLPEGTPTPEPGPTPTDTPAPEGELPAGTPTPEGLPEPLALEEAQGEEVAPEQEVLQVVVPATLDFMLDPLEMGGRGQIYCDGFLIENYGEADVLLTMTEIGITFANDTDFVALTEPYEFADGLQSKAIYLVLEFAREGIAPIVLTEGSAQEISLLLAAQGAQEGEGESSIMFFVTGNLNAYAAKEWGSGDVRIHVSYHLEVLGSEK